MLPDLRLKLFHNLRMFSQIRLGILAPLSDLIAIVREPRSALAYQITAYRKIQDISLFRDTFAEHNIEFRFFKRRRNLILHNLHTRPVPYHISALLQSLGPSDVHSDRRIELKGASAGSRLRIPEHDAYLLPQLVDKDHNTVRLTYDRRQFTERLRHQPCLHMAVSHISFYLLLRHQSRDRVHYNDIHRSGSYHSLRNLKGLISAVRLRDIQFINIHTDILCIDRIQRMLRVYKSGNPASLLHFRDHM